MDQKVTPAGYEVTDSTRPGWWKKCATRAQALAIADRIDSIYGAYVARVIRVYAVHNI